jgi:predicted outer membrane protein
MPAPFYCSAIIISAISFSAIGGVKAEARTIEPAISSAGLSVGRLGILDLDAQVAPADQNVAALRSISAVEAYEDQAGRLGVILAKNFSIRRLAIGLQADRNQVDVVLKSPMATAAMPAGEATLTALPEERLGALFNLDDQDFDRVFVASEIQTAKQALVSFGVYATWDIGAQTREALDMATDNLEHRLAQAQTLQRELW